ncbi:hypothetical protein [Mucilaginibacter phyllosphaerae]|uniref:Uncharacterized protein n=1 Tax=Mucilaginibacter phyllosphaerae TaxID=1812349 RepID=A0A4Y8AJL0_9SPHI|nr:hypothetical protein [Mucilaginibacter phyllosphaerae]MBB3967746.1 hypothetical protein [Mucilaginibacter phyllosphaerae]TEW69204.1 hypothetical protein E2R65_03285 [Mucilaginibacter phyllosphaerae]GGH03633.1 hypothetical protein GCM10007352_06360 [Mucilaginibacter phyllosphaerae]
MFDKPYRFCKVGSDKAHNKKHLKEVITYSFRSGIYYLVEVEVYTDDIYIIKYYLKKHKNNPLKYNLLTGENKCSRIISTCIRIMLSIYTQNKQASFGFLGATIIKGDFEEAKQETKRFTVYKSAVIRLFGVETFTHHRDSEHSTYLMVNNRNKDIDAIKDKAKKMFEEIFPSLDS